MHTVTSDNGKEFAKHESIAKNLDAQFFFAHPYASWESGLNETLNQVFFGLFISIIDPSSMKTTLLETSLTKFIS